MCHKLKIGLLRAQELFIGSGEENAMPSYFLYKTVWERYTFQLETIERCQRKGSSKKSLIAISFLLQKSNIDQEKK